MPSHIETATHLLLEQQTKGPANREKNSGIHCSVETQPQLYPPQSIQKPGPSTP